MNLKNSGSKTFASPFVLRRAPKHRISSRKARKERKESLKGRSCQPFSFLASLSFTPVPFFRSARQREELCRQGRALAGRKK